jgi:hypothetical protein
MEIWGFTGLFEHGACAESDSAKGFGPSPIEDRLRIDHPEWIPIDRRGLRRQSGPIELAYPEARRLLVGRYADAIQRGNYDGLMFYTYVEHFAMTFADEYGFSEPIVAEFQRRYGQDIRREPFDRQAWYRLRGEYVTQFLRELKTEFRRRGKKLGVAIDPQDSHFTAPWLCVRTVRPAGPIYIDWQRWVRESLLDELMVFCNGDQASALHDVLAVTEGTPCRVSAIQGPQFPAELRHFERRGVSRAMVGSFHGFEAGYADPRPPEALDQADPLAKMRVLEDVRQGRTKVEPARLIRAASDPHVLVRRQAVAALAALGSAAAIAAIHERLDDPEHSVRCAAVEALARVQGPATVSRLFAAVRAHGNFQFNMAVTTTLSRMKADRTAEILRGVTDRDVSVRRSAAYALRSGPTRPEAREVLLGALTDADACVRFAAAAGLARFAGRQEVIEALAKALDDRDVSVRSRVACTLASSLRSSSRWLGPAHWGIYQRLRDRFAQFGQGYDGPDAAWGYRPIGNALLAMGPRGSESLQGFLCQTKDAVLADRAWHVLYVPQTGYTYATLTEAEALRNYQRHPRFSRPTMPAIVPEPLRMPYLAQSFDRQPDTPGPLGNSSDDSGLWRVPTAAHPELELQDKLRHGDRGFAARFHRRADGHPSAVTGVRTDYQLRTEPTRVEFWVYRRGKTASFAVLWRSTNSHEAYVGAHVRPDGHLAVMTKDKKWSDTGTLLPPDAWQRMAFDVDPAKLEYSVRMGEKLETVVREKIAIPPGLAWNLFYAAPQPPEGGTFFLDDVRVTVPNPAYGR